jgi:hypothetical protein
MPAATDAAITAISLLTVPAASDASVLTASSSVAGAGQAVSAYLWQHVHSMYGFGGYTAAQVGRWVLLGTQMKCVIP